MNFFNNFFGIWTMVLVMSSSANLKHLDYRFNLLIKDMIVLNIHFIMSNEVNIFIFYILCIWLVNYQIWLFSFNSCYWIVSFYNIIKCCFIKNITILENLFLPFVINFVSTILFPMPNHYTRKKIIFKYFSSFNFH